MFKQHKSLLSFFKRKHFFTSVWNFHHVGFHYCFNDFFGHEVTAFFLFSKIWTQKARTNGKTNGTQSRRSNSANEWSLQFVLNLLHETCSTWLELSIFLTTLFICFSFSKHFFSDTPHSSSVSFTKIHQQEHKVLENRRTMNYKATHHASPLQIRL